MEKKLVKIGEAAEMLAPTPRTLRKWKKNGELMPYRKTASGTRYHAVIV